MRKADILDRACFCYKITSNTKYIDEKAKVLSKQVGLTAVRPQFLQKSRKWHLILFTKIASDVFAQIAHARHQDLARGVSVIN